MYKTTECEKGGLSKPSSGSIFIHCYKGKSIFVVEVSNNKLWQD